MSDSYFYPNDFEIDWKIAKFAAMKSIFTFVADLWSQSGLSAHLATASACTTSAIITLAIGGLLYALLNGVAGYAARAIVKRTSTKIDDILLRPQFLKWVWILLASIWLEKYLPISLLPSFKTLSEVMREIVDVASIALGTKAAVELVKGIFMVLFEGRNIDAEVQKMEQLEQDDMEYQCIPSHSLRGVQQMVCIVIVCIGAILIVATLLGKNPLIIISGLGAGAAVLMLVFKDSILGVVAGIQLTANDMLRPGDWIVAQRFGANGRVQEVTLATVKVLNWDHTIVTIPPYQLITDSFQNWRKMEESGGRRVMRSINVDMSSIRHLSPEEAEHYKTAQWAQKIDWSKPVSNITAFRHFLKHYISQLPTLKSNMLNMVRELAPTPEGLPIEIYFFTNATSWALYEEVQADAIDGMLAALPDFGLKAFQSPAGHDIRGLYSLNQPT